MCIILVLQERAMNLTPIKGQVINDYKTFHPITKSIATLTQKEETMVNFEPKSNR